MSVRQKPLRLQTKGTGSLIDNPLPPTPHIYSIDPGAPFLSTLCDVLISGDLFEDVSLAQNPQGLASITIYLPTRRSVYAFRSHLSGLGTAAILPDIRPLADIASPESYSDLLDWQNKKLPFPLIGPNERLLLLAGLIENWHKNLSQAIISDSVYDRSVIGGSPFEIFGLAQNLATLLDTFTIHGVIAADVDAIIPENHDQFWEFSQSFLSILTKAWPDILNSLGLNDPIATQISAILDLATQIDNGALDRRIVIAGSTGSMPATAALMKAVARSANGRVVLPGLDINQDQGIFQEIQHNDEHSNHPQFILGRLMRRLGIAIDQVKQIGIVSPVLQNRQWYASCALLPAFATESWQKPLAQKNKHIEPALKNCAIVQAADEDQECKAIACAIRETACEPTRTLALVCAERALVNRVTSILDRWSIAYHDTADISLVDSNEGLFLIALAEWLAEPTDAARICNLLSNPLADFGIGVDCVEGVLSYLDLVIFRDNAPAQSLIEIHDRIVNTIQRKDASTRGKPTSDDSSSVAHKAADFIQNLCKFLDTHSSLKSSGKQQFEALVKIHKSLLLLAIQGNTERMTQNFADILESLEQYLKPSASVFTLTARDYIQILPTIIGKTRKPLLPLYTCNIFIYGLLEARLMRADRIILAGLNEQSWPPQPQPDAFMTRAMRQSLNLPQPEQAIGQTAHDFIQSFMAAEDVVLTRSLKKDGTPTIESRFLQRLAAFAGPEDSLWQAACLRGQKYISYAKALYDVQDNAPAARPAPVIAKHLMPARIAITDAEILVRDAYAFYARRVLALPPPTTWNDFSEAQMKGIIIHDAFAALSQNESDEPFAIGTWTECIESLFESYRIPERNRIFWRPSFREIGDWFIRWNRQRRSEGYSIAVELSGAMQLILPDNLEIILSGRADRIEHRNGAATIFDFKTGRTPTKKEAESGLSPQLTLEAALVAQGSFGEGLSNNIVNGLAYVDISLTQGTSKLVELFSGDPESIASIAQSHLKSLQHRLWQHAEGRAGFVSRRFPVPGRRPGIYDHLARVAEWSRISGSEDNE